MRKYLFSLAILSLVNLAAAPATTQHVATPWELLEQAGGLPATDSPRSSSLEYRSWPPYPKEWWDMAWDSEQQNGQIFSLLRQSRLLMEKNGHRAGAPTPHVNAASIQKFLGPLNPLRNMANISSDAALFSHLNGNDAEALARQLDQLNIAACVGQSHLVICQLVATGIHALGASNIFIMAPTLRITIPATRTEVSQLIRVLLDETSFRQNFKDSFAWELHESETLSAPHVITTQPVMMTPAQVEHDLPLLEKAADFQSLPESLALIKQCSFPGTVFYPDRIYLTEFRVLSERRMAATALAIQLYRADHQGNWPISLNDLSPAYLPSIPRDPFRADHAPIGYKIIPHGWPDGKDRPVLFVDAGADISQLGNYPRLGWYTSGKKSVRQYRDLSLPKAAK